MSISRFLPFSLLFVLSFVAKAQEPQLLPQQDLAQWGIRPANYSGIAPLGGDRYAVVSDKEDQDGFFTLLIRQDLQTGQVISVEDKGFRGNPNAEVGKWGCVRDCEGVAYCGQRGTVFISGEGDQKVLEYAMDGLPTGNELQVPQEFARGKILSNAGFVRHRRAVSHVRRRDRERKNRATFYRSTGAQNGLLRLSVRSRRRRKIQQQPRRRARGKRRRM